MENLTKQARNCEHCGRPLDLPANPALGMRKRFCCQDCRMAAHSEKRKREAQQAEAEEATYQLWNKER